MRESLTDAELEQIDVLTTSRSFTPDNQLLVYRKRTMFWGGIVALYFIAGIQIQSANIGVIGGSIDNPQIVKYFLMGVYLYYFVGFFVWSLKEYTKFNLTFTVKKAFIDQISMKTLYKTIRRWESENQTSLIEFKHDLQSYSSPDNKDGVDKIIQIEIGDESVGKIQKYNNIPTTKIHRDKNNKPYLEYNYTMNEQELRAWEKSKSYLRTVPFWEFYEYLLPLIFGIMVTLLMIYYICN